MIETSGDTRDEQAGPKATHTRADDDLERRFRGVQLEHIQRFTPIMMLGNVVNAALFLLVAWGAGSLVFAGPWFAFILVYSGLAIRSWMASRARDPARGASARASRRATLNAFVLGTAWGVAALVLYPASDAAEQTVVAVITGGMIYGGGFALSAVPAALNAFLVPLVTSGVVALAMRTQPSDFLLGIPLLVFAFIIQRAGIGHARLLRANFEDRERIADQSNVISLLLREFERGTSDWLWQIDERGRLVRGVERTAEAIDVPVERLRESDFRDLTANCCEHPECQTDILQRHLTTATPFRDVEVFFPNPRPPRWLRLSGRPIHDATGAAIGFRGVASDITTEKASKQRIAYLASHDALTGLRNRASFGEALEEAFEERTQVGGTICLFWLDLDGFKEVNDRRGHVAGDRLLVDVARRITEAAGAQGLVARIGGDEFAVVMRHIEVEMALSLGSRLIHAIGQPLSLDGDSLRIGVSVGIAFAGPDVDAPERLISAADLALYRAKAGGRNTVRVFDASMRARARRRRELRQGLGTAIERGELELHYQPIVTAVGRRVAGFEALLRWRHPELGLLLPGDFIPLAEVGGAIHEIGAWVAREACRTAAAWPDPLFVTINLSPDQFRSPDLLAEIDAAVRAARLAPRRLEAELTEGVLIDDAVDVARKLHALRDIGITTALDDFGTGYSSFGYLTTFGFNRLKIDRALVHRGESDARARRVLEAIVAMSRALGIETTGEGVETARHVDVLCELGCDLLQGYHISRPLPAGALADWLRPGAVSDAVG
jgi:diguanylate cyclase (GGDEF)-like protein